MKSSSDRKANLYVNWLVENDKIHGRKTEQFCDSVIRERKVVRTEAEPVYDLASTKKVVRTEI